MVTVRAFLIFSVFFLAGHVGSNHIKRDRIHHRSQCRPRLTPSAEDGTTRPTISTPYGRSQTTPTPPHPHTSSAFKAFSTSILEATQSTATRSTPTPSIASITQDIVPTSGGEITKPRNPSPLEVSLTPNNIKAGIAGGDAYRFVEEHIGWWYDWSPNPSKPGSPIAVAMLWGNGTADAQDAERLAAFKHLSTAPLYVLGFEEPDCPNGSGSAGMSVSDGVSKWESLIAPLRAHGTKLGSPSMCKQADETWLAQFEDKISTPWDFTAIHVNKNSLDGVKKDIEHYVTHGKPIWVTEFACVDGKSVYRSVTNSPLLTEITMKDLDQFTPCTDQEEINNFINEIVPYFESNPNIFAYAYSNGEGLGDVWPLVKGDSLSESGQTYLDMISKYH